MDQRVPLIVSALVTVGALQGWLQERVSKSPGFNAHLLIAAESSVYVFGGLTAEAIFSGVQGVQKCFDMKKYALFLPASVCFLLSVLCQYPSVRTFGALQHNLMSQFGLLITALLCWIVRGQRQSLKQAIALLQVGLGIVLLLQLSGEKSTVKGKVHDHVQAHAEIVTAGLFLLSSLFTGSMAAILLERALKANVSAGGIHVQMHQLNIWGFLVAISFYLHERGQVKSGPGGAVPGGLGRLELVYVCTAACRGVVNALTLQVAGALMNGVAGLMIMVGVGLLQVAVDQRSIPGPMLSVQALLISSVFSYLVAEPAVPHLSGKGASSAPQRGD